MEKTLIGYTHDQLSGAWQPRVNEPDHPKAKALTKLLETHAFTDAVEVTLGANDKVKATPMARSASAAIRIAANLLRQGRITPAMAIGRIPLNQFLSLIGKRLAPNQDPSALTKIGAGLGAAVGAAAGQVALTSEQAVAIAALGTPVVLVVDKTTPEDMTALKVVEAIVTRVGGYTSHAAVVARQMGKPCVVDTKFTTEPQPGENLIVDATSGTIFTGTATFEEGKVDDDMLEILQAADATAKLGAYANADTPEDVAVAIQNGARGVGLCRTEHTFFSEEGAAAIRQMILATGKLAKKVAVSSVENLQRLHFRAFFTALGQRPATIRLLDPPLHEFLPDPHDKEKVKALAKSLKRPIKDLTDQIHKLQEENPMLGHRGCRLAITTDGLYEGQVRAIIRAAIDVQYTGELGLMVPLVVDPKELATIIESLRKTVAATVAGCIAEEQPKVTFGTMLETPRACIVAAQLADVCDFVSFGTNDLTQATWALSRDDSAGFLHAYAVKEIFADPFVTIDFDGVGALMAHAIEGIRAKHPDFKIGICGEHGGDPTSIGFCHSLGLSYVSCAPPRLLIARLAAGHANVAIDAPLALLEIDLPKDEPVEPPKPVEPQAPKAPAINLADLPITVLAPPPPLPLPIAKAYMDAALPPIPKMFAPPPPIPGTADQNTALGPTPLTSGGTFTLPKGISSLTPSTFTGAPVPPPVMGQAATLAAVPNKIFSGAKPASPQTPQVKKLTPEALKEIVDSVPPKNVAKLSAAALLLHGTHVQHVKADGTTSAPGTVAGYVASPYTALIVIVFDVPNSAGHDGKILKAHIKWTGFPPSPEKAKQLWLCPINELKVA